jgi:uncharacterized membrane protein
VPAAASILVVTLDVLSPTPNVTASVDPTGGSHGFAAYMIGGFFGLGLIMLVAFLFSRRPRSVKR